MPAREELQTRLDYSFQDSSLLKLALTHRSKSPINNERLEYLGDSVLGFFVTEKLYCKFPEIPVGVLTRMRSRLVCNDTLVSMARSLELQKHMCMGRGEQKPGDNSRDSVLANAFEALVGAVYLDSSLAQVIAVLDQIFGPRLQTIEFTELKDPKSRLQEFLQRKALPLPVYQLVERGGKDHSPIFTVSCIIESEQIEFTVSEKTLRLAEQIAASKALTYFNGRDV